ncbi:hypothetical protein HYH03_010051 [Edaphochlamys debaryana]|uniref:Uncharacterized protein n=1 Tax=Edaphochlamys debaryana TaxID=47281 RepID=A0A836BXX4_9CHLO|nr:hypothetical protein HYH03_010051 [Edaphochlamys debaryana]|eukprot:KAG2491683.1 hypothetical protein HYH03_010051 [Edaphochlamys debaryana]
MKRIGSIDRAEEESRTEILGRILPELGRVTAEEVLANARRHLERDIKDVLHDHREEQLELKPSKSLVRIQFEKTRGDDSRDALAGLSDVDSSEDNSDASDAGGCSARTGHNDAASASAALPPRAAPTRTAIPPSLRFAGGGLRQQASRRRSQDEGFCPGHARQRRASTSFVNPTHLANLILHDPSAPHNAATSVAPSRTPSSSCETPEPTRRSFSRCDGPSRAASRLALPAIVPSSAPTPALPHAPCVGRSRRSSIDMGAWAASGHGGLNASFSRSRLWEGAPPEGAPGGRPEGWPSGTPVGRAPSHGTLLTSSAAPLLPSSLQAGPGGGEEAWRSRYGRGGAGAAAQEDRPPTRGGSEARDLMAQRSKSFSAAAHAGQAAAGHDSQQGERHHGRVQLQALGGGASHGALPVPPAPGGAPHASHPHLDHAPSGRGAAGAAGAAGGGPGLAPHAGARSRRRSVDESWLASGGGSVLPPDPRQFVAGEEEVASRAEGGRSALRVRQTSVRAAGTGQKARREEQAGREGGDGGGAGGKEQEGGSVVSKLFKALHSLRHLSDH